MLDLPGVAPSLLRRPVAAPKPPFVRMESDFITKGGFALSGILDQLNEPAVPIVINHNGSLMAVTSVAAGTNITVGSSYRID